jgi:hypothetical protein
MSRKHGFDRFCHSMENGLGGSESRRSFLVAGAAAAASAALSPLAFAQSSLAAGESQTRFVRVPTQFIAALGAPDATAGRNAQSWGLWRQDPGPRGVRLGEYERLSAAGGVAPAGWKFDSGSWWLEEHGLIMEAPDFPIPSGQYVVTGYRQVTAVLTIHPVDDEGAQRWELDRGARLYDVTHLRCRSALYTPATNGQSCSPAMARQSDFPVAPGAAMPPVGNCSKQDYAVLIVIGMAAENA